MKKSAVLLLVVLNMVACSDNATTELTAAQQVEKRLASTKPEPAVTPAAMFNQQVQATPGLAPLNQAGELFAQQTQKVAAPIGQILQEGWGTELQSKQTSFNGQHITYQYQLWKVKPKSVCSHVKHEVTRF